MIEHLPALLIVLPMVGAPLNLLVRSSRLSWLLSSAILATALGISLQLVQRVMATGPVAYEMGGWAAPVGITYHIDAVGAFVTVIVTLVSFVAMLYARRSVDDELPADVHYLFYAAWLLCTTGLLGMTVTGDAFNVFVFLEISSLSSYVLIGLGRDRRALTAALQYLIMGSIGGTFILVGIGLMYAMTGTLNMADLAVRLGPVMDTRAVLVSFAFITVGASLKLALWPLHFWLPNAYTYAPSAVSAFISATSTKVMVYVLMRFALTIYGV
ncbi:MAG: complex I subunit 5 family protein, partial [Myxococcota bacterium]